MKVIGVTGGIASGKSLVSKFLGQLGCEVIDADRLGHATYPPGSVCMKEMVAEFGPRIVAPDGTVNRRELGSIVFADQSQMDKLTGIVWPHIRAALDERVAAARAAGDAEVVVVEAAVLLKAGWGDMCDEVWTVEAPLDVQRKRLMARNSLSAEEADTRLRAQAELAFAVEGSRSVRIANDGTIADLGAKVVRLLKERLRGGGEDEVVLQVDEDNNIVGEVPRSVMRKRNLWHRATFIVIKNSKDELYVQKRTYIKDYCPGWFDPVTGGVVATRESYELSAAREAEEELGVTAPLKYLGTFKHEDDRSRVWGGLFECVWDGPITPQPSEVEHVEMISLPEVFRRHKAGTQQFTPDGIHALQKYQRYVQGISQTARKRTWLVGAAAISLVAFAGVALLGKGSKM